LVVNAWINSRFVMSAAAREILVAWSSRVVDSTSEMIDPDVLHERSVFTESLAYMVPRENVLSSMVCGVWTTVIQPVMAQTDVAMAQLDGYVLVQVFIQLLFAIDWLIWYPFLG
jgi:hypothetical protein